MPQDNVLSLNAFGELIEPKKRKYGEEPQSFTSPVKSEDPYVSRELIPLKVVSPSEEPQDYKFPSPEEFFGKKSKSGESEAGKEQANHVASKVLHHMAQTKLLHWQTKSLAEHEALDKLFGDLVDLGDELTESVMGKYGRPHLSEEESCLRLTNYENPGSPDGLPRFIESIDSCFRNECSPLFPEDKDPEIHNIIQEILGKIDKIAYLLTLKK